MWALKCRERIAFQQDFQAALHPEVFRDFRLSLGNVAFDKESEDFMHYVSGIAGEKHITMSE